jgi:hypothetical protein
LEYLKILKDYEGIIGTILGSLSTLIISDILKGKGRLKIYLNEWDEKFLNKKELGICTEDDKESAIIEQYKYNLSLHIYNSSESIKIMRKISVNFYCNNDLLLKSIPYDPEKSIGNGRIERQLNHVEVINIKPKEVFELHLFDYIDETKFIDNHNFNKIVFEYLDNKSKIKTFLIRTK